MRLAPGLIRATAPPLKSTRGAFIANDKYNEGPGLAAGRGATEGGRDSGLLWEDVESAAKNVAKAGTPRH